MSEMIERVARAINPDIWRKFDERAKRKGWTAAEKAQEQAERASGTGLLAFSLRHARAAIEAMREPTEAMLGAHEAVCVFRSQDEREDYRDNLREAWATMIDAALATQSTQS